MGPLVYISCLFVFFVFSSFCSFHFFFFRSIVDSCPGLLYMGGRGRGFCLFAFLFFFFLKPIFPR